ncbi:MAG: DUF1491 family protein [Pseudomonadota bacterium]
MARLTTSVFASGLIRQINGAGGSAVIARKGSPEAGAIYISRWLADERLYALYVPALIIDESLLAIGGRAFRELEDRFEEARLADYVARESSFDPDFWLVEIENCTMPIEAMITLLDDD